MFRRHEMKSAEHLAMFDKSDKNLSSFNTHGVDLIIRDVVRAWSTLIENRVFCTNYNKVIATIFRREFMSFIRESLNIPLVIKTGIKCILFSMQQAKTSLTHYVLGLL